jgi:GTP-binding protein
MGEVYAISAAHGRGVDELIEAVVEVLELPPPVHEQPDEHEPWPDEVPEEPEVEDDSDRELRVAFIGKPNAGKSSLMNRLVGVERSLVHHVPGTTTDPVDTPFEFAGSRYVLVDTAGIRRKGKIDADAEKIAVSMALGQIRRADVIVLVVDGSIGLSEQDARLAGAIEQNGRAVVIALNKSDLLDGPGAGKELREQASDELHFISYAPYVHVSALRGEGLGKLMSEVDRVATEHKRRVTTGELNRFFAEVLETHPPPVYKNRAVRINYMTQGGIRPPTFLLWASRPDGVSPSYRRFIANQLRARYGFGGTPLRVIIKSKKRSKSKRAKGKKRGGRR